MKKDLAVLIIEDCEDDALLLVRHLQKGGYGVTYERVDSRDQLTSAVEKRKWDIVLSDYSMPGFTGSEALQMIQDRGLDTPFIFVSGTMGEDVAVGAMKAGARDYVMKGNLLRLVPTIERELHEMEVRGLKQKSDEELRKFRKAADTSGEVIFTTDRQGVFTYVNGEFTRLYGYTLDEVLGNCTPRILKSGRLTPAEYEQFWQGLVTGRTFRSEILNKGKDGRFILVDATVSSIVENGDIVGFLAIERDVTERKRADDALRESEERFRLIADTIDEVFWIAGAGLDKVIYASPAFEKIWGRTREALYGNPRLLEESVLSEDVSKFISVLEAEKLGLAFDREYRIVRPDGDVRTIWDRGYPIRGENGEITVFVGVAQDITRRKESDAALESANSQLRYLFSNLDEAFFSIDLKKDELIQVSPAYQRIFDVDPGNFVSTKEAWFEKILPEDRPSVNEIFPALASGRSVLHQYRIKRSTGEIRWIEANVKPTLDDEGKLVRLDGIAMDVTARKLAEERLRTSEEQFRLISENVADMITVVGPDGKREYCSPSFKNFVREPDLLKGSDAFAEILPEDRGRVMRVFEEILRTGIGQWAEYRFLPGDGTVRDIESQASAFRREDGKVAKVVVVSRDVTEQKKLEQQLMQAQRLESIGTLASGIAHDLNNVLAPIMMAIEIIRSKVPDPEGKKLLDTIETSAKRGSSIVKQVLAFGRGIKGEQISLQLKHVINEVVKIAEETFPKSIDVQTNIQKNLWTVLADPTQMHQVLLNVCVNARDAMPHGGTLSLSAENITLDKQYARMNLDAREGSFVVVSVADTGTGIPENVRDKIFEPFFTTKEIGKGTGLGLSTTLGIVRSHKGFINVYTEVGKGTTIRIYLPATGVGQGAGEEEKSGTLPMGNGETVLVIDDESAIREITRETLLACGYRVFTASDGAEGIAIYAEHRGEIAVVVTDIMMPVMDGTAVIRALQRLNPRVKIIAVSGMAAYGRSINMPNSSVSAFLAKPYTAEKLLVTVAEVLKSK